MDTLRDAPMEALQSVIDLLCIWGNNFRKNFWGMWTGMDATRWFRLLAVVGVYMIFRNFVVKKAEAKQAREHAKAMVPEPTGKISPNALRAGTTGKKVSFDESTEEEDEDASKATGAEWGKKAKKRQKQLVKKQMELDELKRREQEGEAKDADIMDMLVDYEKGKDGW